MRLAITSTGKDLDAQVDPRFGRAHFILIVDSDRKILDVIDNETNRDAMGGAGIATAKLLVDRKVDVLLTGPCGPNALTALATGGVKICEISSGTAGEALERFNRGELHLENMTNPATVQSPVSPGNSPGQGLGRGGGMGGGMRGGRGMGGGMGKGRRNR